MTDPAAPATPSTGFASGTDVTTTATAGLQALSETGVSVAPAVAYPVDRPIPSAPTIDGPARAIPRRLALRGRLVRALATTRRAQAALVAAVLVLFFVVAANPYRVEQFSMERTLEPGEILLVDRVLPSVTGFSRGDIVIFKLATSGPGSPPLVKRIVGLPGDSVAFRDGAVWVNGVRLDEPYVFDDQPTWPQPGKPSALVVPAGSVLVLGDHRSSSADSRLFGPVPVDRIIGRVWFEARFSGLAAILGN